VGGPKLLKGLYQTGAGLTKAVPPHLRHGLAGFGGDLWYALSPGRRRAASANYAAVLELPPDHPQVRRVMRRAFANYGRMLADFLLMGDLDLSELGSVVTLTGREHVDAALALGRGAILALPHMGSWDFAGSLAGVRRYRVAAVAEKFPGSLDEAVVGTRAGQGVEIIPLGPSAARRVFQVLRENGLVALLCDLPHGPGVEVELFGKRAIVPAGPGTIAYRAGVPLLPACAWRTDAVRHHVRVDPPIAPPTAGTAKEAAGDMMQRLMRRFEVFIREHPDQWYAFRRILY
jgi:lauroyl/myristoyl acyltransferase